MQKSKDLDLSQNLLHLIQDRNFDAFEEVISNFSQQIVWKDVVHRKSFDSAQHVAARVGALHILRYLREVHEVDLEQVNADGKRPLHEAAQSGQIDCVRFLLSCRVAVDSLKRADWTPLMLACTKDRRDVIVELLENGANPYLVNKDGWNSFHIACREGHIEIVTYLLDHYSDIWKTKSHNGRTPLHTAALHGHEDCVRLLLTRTPCNPDEQDSCGSTPVMDCVRAGHINVMKILMETRRVDIYERDHLGRTAFHLAAQAGSLDIIIYFLDDLRADVNSLTLDNQTALHLAAKEGKLEAIKTLLFHNCDYKAKDDKGRTGFDICKANGFTSCMNALQF